MSLNTAHAQGGVLIHAGENILLFCDNVEIEFSGQDGPEFKGKKSGRMYLTTHRMIFNSKKSDDPMKSFSFPFVVLKDVELEQPIFGANYIKGKVKSQPSGSNFIGEVKFKLHFKSGGAIDFGQAMLKAAQIASRNVVVNDPPPPYTPPTSGWYAAPPPAYAPPAEGYQGWVPPTHVFPDQPPANTVFMTDAPPPYPGITGYQGYSTGAAGGMIQPQANGQQPAQVQVGYYDPNNPQFAYVPPPAYQEPIAASGNKKDD
eukprot:TRINITY_DN2018_c0_g5_i1.p1 TRINITY_DN2018_c0_g5~~TRINITY_DN2018_c0_g5_i1.p1  ORF type:complete len:259 (-),score=74.72 TRINITY_DN2018_c0_g5_i1:302-1078(-)